jgi:Flp pilus assembly protein TadG
MKPTRSGAFLARLAQDKRGNTLAIMAAALIPLVGLIGGGVDASRMYLVKARLQQACDAGSLAGRKAMGGGSWDSTTQARANQLFTANFASGAYGTTSLNPDFTEDDGIVTGTASVNVPMTLMRVFGFSQQSVNVTCTAKMEIPNTDVMFVLDVTASMLTDNKIGGLHSAVKCFYEALMRVNTSEVCGTNDPTATSSSTTAQIRLGFVPYGVNVNVGKLLPNDYLANQWKYQTRQGVFYEVGTPVSGSAYDESTTAYSSSSSCKRNWAIGTDTTGFPSTSTTPDSFTVTTTTYTFVSFTSATSGGWWWGGGTTTNTCTRRVNQSQVTYTRDDTNGTYFHTWIYKQAALDVSGLKAGGSNWNSSVSLRLGDDGDYTNISWDGCIEERKTFKNTDGDLSDDWGTIPADAIDMDIDRVPDQSNADTLWGPMLPGAVWGRYTSSGGYGGTNRTLNDVTTASDLNSYHNKNYYCPVAARKLTEYKTVGDLETYIDSLAATAYGTYHDIGMLWGARLLSPTGIFASENASTPSGGTIQRHLIFMTDGDASTDTDNLYAYGLPWWDRRQTSDAPSNGDLNDAVNARLVALCTAIKNKNITLWVISYGGDVNEENEARLEACATPGHYYSASDGAALITQFQQIASEIADLRLTN